MADAQVTLKVILESAGTATTVKDIKVVQDAIQKTAKSTRNLSNEQNKMKRNLEGVAQRSNRAGKDFSRMSQGMGGLVQAYATVAANVFALSSAFLVLRKAADLSSMEKSAKNFSDRFGVSVERITKRMQEASGGALDFAEALPSINKAVSAGVGIEQMEKLTIAATKASQTFGGTTTEALNRFISASQRGRVEIIQTLGVVIKTEDAYKEYAAQIGKTALELTAFDRQQAILNATVKESQKVFDGIEIDPNPFTRFASTLVDLKDTILTTVTDFVTPLINAFNQSKHAAALFIALITKSVAGRIFPEFTSLLSGLTAASISSNVKATEALRKANSSKLKANAEYAKNSGRISERSIRNQIKREEASYAKRQKKHAAFVESIFNKDGSVNAKRLNQQKAFLRKQEEAIIKGKGITQTLSTDLTVIRRQIDERVRLGQVTGAVNTSEKLWTQTIERRSTFITKQIAGLKALTSTFKSYFIGLKSGIITGFSKSFQTMQTNVLLGLKKMSATWRVWYESIGVSGVNSLKRFSEAFGRTVGVVLGGLSRLISVATSAFLYWQLAQYAIEKFGDNFRGISKEQRAALNSFESLGDELSDITDRTENYLASTRRATVGLEGFIKQAEFLRGTFDSIKTSVDDFQTALNRLFALHGTQDFIATFKDMRLEIEKTQNALGNIPLAARSQDLGDVTGGGPIIDSQATVDANKLENSLRKLKLNFDGVESALRELTKESGPALVGNLASTIKLLNETKFDSYSEQIVKQVTTGLEESLGQTGNMLAELVRAGQWPQLIAAMLSMDNVAERATAFQIIANALGTTAEKAHNLNGNFVASGKALEETNRRMGVYIDGLEKARAASVPNKDVFNLLLDTRRAFKDLSDTAKAGEVEESLNEIAKALELDLETLREFLNLKPGSSTEDALAKVNEELSIYNAVIEDSITKTSRNAAVQNRLTALKQEEIDSDKRKIQIIGEIEQAEKDKIRIQETSAKLALEVAEKDLARIERFGETETLTRKQALATIAALKEEIIGHKLATEAIDQRVDTERKLFEVRQAALATEEAINKTRLSTLKIYKSISVNNEQDLKLRYEIFNLEKNALDIEKRKLIEEINRLTYTEKNTQEVQRRTNEIQRELQLLEAQTAQLERQRLLLRAETAEQSGVSIFDREGLSLAAEFFITEVRDQARNLKTTFQILGEGFVSAINNSFDAAVDNLLEGGKDFGRVMVETIKEQLRNVFGEALKTQIRDAFAGIFAPQTEEQKADQRHQEALTASEIQTFALRDNTEALRSVEMAFRNSANIISPTIPIGPGGPRKPEEGKDSTTSALETVAQISEKGFGGIEEVLNMGNDIATVAKDENTKGLFNIFGILGNLISILGSTFASGGGSFLSLFGFNRGGMIPGGTSFTQRAGGGITRGPELALIGEGRRNEAVVPLPNNREIPVQLMGSSGDTINIQQNFDFTNADPSAIPRLRQEARAIEERTFNRVFNEINKGGKYAKISGRR